MNEKIRALAFTAAEGSNWKPGLGNEQVALYMEAFAKLIIMECASIDFRHKVGLSYEQDYEVTKAIEDHFGVE